MIEASERAPMEDNLHMFKKKLPNHNPSTYDGVANPEAFEDWIWGSEKMFDALQYHKEWRVGFARVLHQRRSQSWVGYCEEQAA